MSSVVNGLLLPFVLVYALSLVNNQKLMGDYTNPKAYNVISWATIIAIIALTAGVIVTTILPAI